MKSESRVAVATRWLSRKKKVIQLGQSFIPARPSRPKPGLVTARARVLIHHVSRGH